MKTRRIKQYLLLLVSVSIFILILCYLPKFVEISLIYTMPIAVISSLTPIFVQEAIKMFNNHRLSGISRCSELGTYPKKIEGIFDWLRCNRPNNCFLREATINPFSSLW